MDLAQKWACIGRSQFLHQQKHQKAHQSNHRHHFQSVLMYHTLKENANFAF
jgi:hypothetical protein